MKQSFQKIISLLLSSSLIIFAITSCSSKNEENKNYESSENSTENIKPLNITVYLDLSDRIIKQEKAPTQIDRDTAIINTLINLFIEDCKHNGKIIKSKNHFQILFYPAPDDSQINTLANALDIDLSEMDPKQKKTVLSSMKQSFNANLTQIYNDAIEEHDFVGSDVWGFFSNKAVDTQCIRKGYRNILVILTDGYLYHKDSKKQEGNAYSYILSQTLENSESSLMVERNGLSDLEVLVLEISPNPADRKKMTSLITDWLNDMEVAKVGVADTDLPKNTANYIKNFLK